MHVSVGLTTDQRKGKGNTNFPLHRSIFEDEETSYMHRAGTVDNVKMYHSECVGVMDDRDLERAKAYGARAKEKYKRKKGIKKQ